MKPLRVLFICVHNTARSQMAEAFCNSMGQGRFQAESAGLEPGTINPLVVEAMAEQGFDLSGKSSQSVFDLFKQGRLFDAVITVCDGGAEAQCPVFPGVAMRAHWPFPDPAAAEGDHEERLERTRAIRDMIRERVQHFVDAE